MRRALADARDALIVSHGHCLDGTGSVIVTLRKISPDRVGVLYAQPGQLAQVLHEIGQEPGQGRTLHIADLSLNPRQADAILDSCRRLKAHGWRIEWRDHHHKQWEDVDLRALRGQVDVLEVNDDFTESGASMMQKALNPDDDLAHRLADTIRDRDLWRNETPDSETLEFAINHMGTERFVAHYLEKGPDDAVVDDEIQRAADLERRRIRDHTRRLLRHARHADVPAGGKVCIVYGWLPKNVGLHQALDQEGVLVAANIRPNGKMSLRSRKGIDICHLICREFGGGGHPNASGADLGLRGVAYLWYVLRRGRVAQIDELERVAVRHLQAHLDGLGADRTTEG